MSDVDSRLADMLIDSGDDVAARRILRKVFAGVAHAPPEARGALAMESLSGELLLAAVEYRTRLAAKCEKVLLDTKAQVERQETAT